MPKEDPNMARYPGARWRPIPRYQPGGHSCVPMSRYDAGVDHTYVGSPSSDAAFAHFNVDGTPLPHFMVFRDGSIDQYVDTRFRSSACLDGNPRVIAWETADGYPTLWTNGQAPKDNTAMVEAKAHLMEWLNKEHGIPLTQMPSSRPTARGMGWHRLGIDGNYEEKPGQLLGGRVAGGERWSPSFGKTCPTSVRIRQFVGETIPAAQKLAVPPPPTGPVRIPKHQLEHPAHGHEEYEGDSHRAIDHAAANDIEWVDLNALRDKDGVAVDTHYPYPLRHGFTDPLGLLHPDTSIFEMTRGEWSRLRAEGEDGLVYRISALEDQIAYALKKGRKVEVDLKCILPARTCKKLIHGDNVVFKTMGSLKSDDPRIGTPGERLEKAKRVDGTTIIICPRPLMFFPKRYRHVFDYFRRFKPRFR